MTPAAFDLLAAIALSLAAAITSSALAIGAGETVADRLRFLAGLGAWFVAVVVLGASEHGLGTPALGLAVAAPIAILAVTVLRSPRLRRALDAMPLWLLIAVNAARVLGVLFVLLYFAGRAPAPFAPLAGWGDIVAGVTAGPVAWLAWRRPREARWVILAWNAFGLADLIDAIGLGVVSSPGPLHLIGAGPGAAIMTTLPWLLIPGFMVPLLALTHLAVFYRLRRPRPSARVAPSVAASVRRA